MTIYNFHLNLQKMLKFHKNDPLCPNCQTALELWKNNYLICEECTKEIHLYCSSPGIYDVLNYSQSLKKRKVKFSINFNLNQVAISYGDNQLTIPGINLPFFDELKMRNKLSLLFTFQ